MKYLALASLLLLSACTNTHRLVMVYESDKAVQGTISIMEEPTPKTVTVVPRETQAAGEIYAPEPTMVEVPEDEKSILDSVRGMLP